MAGIFFQVVELVSRTLGKGEVVKFTMVGVLVPVVDHVSLGGAVVTVSKPGTLYGSLGMVGGSCRPAVRLEIVEIKEIMVSNGPGWVAAFVRSLLSGDVAFLAVQDVTAITLVLAGK